MTKEVITSNISMKVSKKGALSLYGIGRFPVTLYKGQWEKVLAKADDIAKFIEDHDDELVEKGEKKKEEDNGNIPDFDKGGEDAEDTPDTES